MKEFIAIIWNFYFPSNIPNVTARNLLLFTSKIHMVILLTKILVVYIFVNNITM
jgi:hypothetical protein